MDTAELSRRLENLIRIGTVDEVDHIAARCRVNTGGLLTGWLPFRAARAGNTRTWCPPTVGEQVMIFSPSGELAAGVVMPGLYQDAHAAPSSEPDLHVMEFPDGATITYDHSNGALSATGITTFLVDASGTITLRSSASVVLETPLTHATGDVTVDGLLTYGNGLAGTGGDNNNVITGSLTQTGGTLSSNGIVLDSHVHTGVQAGGSNTGGPA